MKIVNGHGLQDGEFGIACSKSKTINNSHDGRVCQRQGNKIIILTSGATPVGDNWIDYNSNTFNIIHFQPITTLKANKLISPADWDKYVVSYAKNSISKTNEAKRLHIRFFRYKENSIPLNSKKIESPADVIQFTKDWLKDNPKGKVDLLYLTNEI